MRFRDTPEGQRQSAVLRDLEQHSGRKRIEIEADLWAALKIQHDQYRRYLRGDTPLRWDQIAVFAQALRTTTPGLTTALGLMDDQPAWTIRAAATGILPEAVIEQMEREYGAEPILDQQARLEDAILAMDELRASATSPQRPPMPGPRSRRDRSA